MELRCGSNFSFALLLGFFAARVIAFTYQSSLPALGIVRIDWDLGYFSSNNMTFATNFTITMTSTADDGQTWIPILLPAYYNSSLNPGEMEFGIAQWQLLNTASSPITFLMNITLLDGSTVDQKEMDSYFSVRRHFKVTKSSSNPTYYLSFVGRSTTFAHIPPFNLLDFRGNFVIAQLRNPTLLSNDYKLQTPFTSSYWSDLAQEVEVLPWLPYLSACQNYGQRIYLHELLDLYDVQSNHVQDLNLYNLDSLLKYRRRTFETRCIFGESNHHKQQVPWWRKPHPSLFYLYPTSVNSSQLQAITQTIKNGLDDQVSSLVAVQYSHIGVPLGVPNRVELTISYLNYTGSNRKIVRAELQAYFEFQEKDNSTLLQIKLVPMDSLQELFNGCASPLTYLLLFVPLLVILATIIFQVSLQSIYKQVLFGKALKFMIGPIYKALILVILACILPIGLLLAIGKFTYFSMIASDYDGNTFDGLITSNIQKSRVGLSMIYSGFCLLIALIGRTYKLPNREQAQILIRELIEQKSLSSKKRQYELEERRLNDRAEFMVEVLTSRRYKVLTVMLVACALQCFLYEQLLSCEKWVLGCLCLLWPILVCIQVETLGKNTDDKLYAVPLHLLGDFVLSVVLIRFTNIWLMIVLRSIGCMYYSCYPLVHSWLQCRLFTWLASRPQSFLSRLLAERISEHCERKQYDRQLASALSYVTSVCSCIFRPVMLLVFYLFQKEANMPSKVFPEPNLVNASLLYLLLSHVLEVGLMLILVDQLRRRAGVDMFETLEFGFHRFRCRSTKWVLDTFKYKSTVRQGLRSVEKLCFSSQFYILVMGMAFALVLLHQGASIIMRNAYVVYRDPAFPVLLFVILLLSRVCDLFVSYVFVRSKFYQLQHQKNRKQLDSVSQFSRKDNYEAYLHLEAVKNHFLMFNKEWIVANLPKILTKRNFHEDGKKLLNRYIYQLNAQKRKQLECRKREAERQRLLQEHQQQAKNQKSILSISKQTMQRVVTPVMLHWLNLSREHLHLRKFVQALKQPLPNCEFCKIDMQLEVLERYPFHLIVNKFRVANIGKVFLPHEFVEFYRTQQQLVTICFECRLKKQHIHRNERLEAARSRNNVCARLLIRKWLICARSRILHRP